MTITWGGAMRWSQSAKGWCGFVASCSDGRLLLRHELTFKNLGPDDAAKKILASCAAWDIPVPTFYAQPEVFPQEKKSRGETVSETFRRCGVVLLKGDDDPINGPSRLRSWLETREWGLDKLKSPGLVIHPDCAYFIETLPTLVEHETEPDEVQPCIEEYPSRGMQFFLMSRPAPSEAMKVVIPADAIYWDVQAIRDANDAANRVD